MSAPAAQRSRRRTIVRSGLLACALAAGSGLALHSGVDTGGKIRDVGTKSGMSRPERLITDADGFKIASSSTKPHAEKPWRVTVTGPEATVRLDVMAFGRKAATIASGEMQRGRFAAVIRWPEKAAGYDVAVQATIERDGGRTVTLNQPLTIYR